MYDYLLFIDTETSGLPKDWSAPYSKEGNWPYAVQVAWIIYTKEKKEVKRANHYINNNDFSIAPSALKIHGLTADFIAKNGESREKVMALLAEDLKQYQPLVIGHFMKFDFHVAGAEFYRARMENPIKVLPTFCTMLTTTNLVKNPQKKYLRLCDLYEQLFATPLRQQHDAMADAEATAACFFELVEQNYINDTTIAAQQESLKKLNQTVTVNKNWILPTLLILLTLIIAFLIWKARFNF